MKRPSSILALLVAGLAISWGPRPSRGAAYIDPGLLLAPAQARIETPATWRQAVDRELLEQGRVRCQIECRRPIDPRRLREWLARNVPSAVWEGHWQRWAQITCSAGDLPRLAEVPEGSAIMRPPIPMPQAQSEGVEPLGAPAYWARGHGGRGVRVAVIDVGFQGYRSLLGRELPEEVKARSFVTDPSGSTDIEANNPHGTAVAEILHDVAPDSELLLANFSTPVELARAVEWALEQGADVINHSIAWFFGPRDGTGDIAAIARSALDRGAVWVNAAGNYAESHWMGAYRDADQNGFLEFDALGTEDLTLGHLRAGQWVSLILWWGRWPRSPDLRLDVQIWRDGRMQASSRFQYGDTLYAYRELSWQVQAGIGPVTVQIWRSDAGRDRSLEMNVEIFRVDGQGGIPEQSVARGSLVIPADVDEVLAVGAAHWSTGALESYSSWGPTLSGLPKPELLASDAVTTDTYNAPFAGTSAAAPHVAGAVALLQSAGPRGGMSHWRWTVSEVRTLLSRSATDAGEVDPDAVVWGRAALPQAPEDVSPQAAALRILPNPTRDGRITLRMPDAPGAGGSVRCRLIDLAGRTVWSCEGPSGGAWLRLALSDPRGRRPAAGTYWLEVWGEGWRGTTRLVVLEE